MKRKIVQCKKVVACAIATAAMIMSLTSCGEESTGDPMEVYTKAELIARYHSLEDQLDSVYNELDSLRETVSGTYIEQKPSAELSVIGDGTGRMTFTSMDSQIMFPSTFVYPGSQEVANTSRISLTNTVSLSAGSNWISRISGASIELEHSSGITGTIKVGQIQKLYDKKLLKDEVLAPWFSELPPSSVIYNDIFLNDTMWGVQASTMTYIDEEEAILRCGMVGFGEVSMQYVFVYRGIRDETKEESISGILNSVKILGLEFRIE